MEVLDSPTASRHNLSFHGKGGQYFGIWIVNALLTIITLGLYYPWARAATLRYFYQETELADSRFQFHGTGREMFLGFIKAIGIIIVLYAVFFGCMAMGGVMVALGFLLFIGGFLALIPFAIHGAAKYRASRTSWRGIHFGYRGELGELVKICLTGGLLTVVTFGIYSFWLSCNIRKYVLGNTRFGNVKFEFRGEGGSLFGTVLVGYLLSILTLGIYFFWFMKDLYKFYVNNIHATQDGRPVQFRSTATGGGFFGLVVVNFLLIIFTLGLATPWVAVRTTEFILRNMEIYGDFKPEEIRQTEAEYRDATGEDMADIMDIGIV